MFKTRVLLHGLMITVLTAQVCAAADDPSCGGRTTETQRKAAQTMIQLSGYDCEQVDSMCPYVFSEGYTVYCNNYRYKFLLENHGGKWSVESD